MNSADAIKYLPEVFAQCGAGNCINVFSAFGKTTNNLEKVLKSYLDKNKSESDQALNELKSFHLGIARDLFEDGHTTFDKIEEIFIKIQQTLSSVTENTNPKFVYDQIIPSGEILAATIASEYLTSVGISNKLVHATDFLKTDANFNMANVDKVATTLTLQK